MSRQDAVKARIKKLESDMLGLTYRLNQMRSSPARTTENRSTSINETFNTKTKRDALFALFMNASQIQSALTQQIFTIRGELANLQLSLSYDHDLRLTA